jgi:hypothetical protein
MKKIYIGCRDTITNGVDDLNYVYICSSLIFKFCEIETHFTTLMQHE